MAGPTMVDLDPDDWNDGDSREVEALRSAIEATHDREHDAVSLMWCGHELCRTMESFR